MPSVNVFPNNVNIAAATQTNVNGGRTVTYAVSYSNVPALITDASASLKLLYQQRNIVIDHMIYITQLISVKTGDIVQSAANNFFIRGMTNPSGTSRVFELHCQEVQGSEIIFEG